MLGQMTPGELDEWIAYSTLEPFGDEWKQAGTIAAEVANGFRTVLAGLAGQQLEERDLARADDYVPTAVRRRSKAVPGSVDLASIERANQQFAARAAAASQSEI